MALDPQSEVVLDAIGETGMLPFRALGVESQRQMTEAGDFSDRAPALGAVENITVGGPTDPRVHLYRRPSPVACCPSASASMPMDG